MPKPQMFKVEAASGRLILADTVLAGSVQDVLEYLQQWHGVTPNQLTNLFISPLASVEVPARAS